MNRDPERLEDFYLQLKDIHKRTFPDFRFGQFMSNFLGWVQVYKGDIFYPEEDRMLQYLKEYEAEHTCK